MTKFFAIALATLALTACDSMPWSRSTANQGNPAETRNSTDANKSGNPAAVSPGGTGASGGSGAR